MASGKSTLGKELADLMQRTFIDLDELIEKKENTSVTNIFSLKGEDYFREIESATLKSLSNFSNAVIATGGGTPCFQDGIHWMNKHGITVYLNVSPTVLKHRLSLERSHRPLLESYKDETLLDYIIFKLSEREPFYMQAKLIVAADNIAAPLLAQAIRNTISDSSHLNGATDV
ncbi:MAG: shikimate kinase [Chitinophagales bacterium]|nr:shikimate kinase [Chitinophagales bacterium]